MAAGTGHDHYVHDRRHHHQRCIDRRHHSAGVLVAAAVLWPYFDKSPTSTIGRWLPRDRKWQNAVFLFIVIFILVLTFIGTFMRGPFWELYMPWQEWETDAQAILGLAKKEVECLKGCDQTLYIGNFPPDLDGRCLLPRGANRLSDYQAEFRGLAAEKFGEERAAQIPAVSSRSG